MACSPKSASPATLHIVSPGYHPQVALDYTTPALDLRKRARSPSPEGARHQLIHPQDYSSATTTLPRPGKVTMVPQAKPEASPEQPTTTTATHYPRSPSESDASEISSTDPIRDYVNVAHKIKATRPFKAFPKDPLSIAAGVATAESFLGKDSSEAYVQFRRHMLAQVQATHGVINKNMRRNNHNQQLGGSVHGDDPGYWEKRRKNNEAAKRSRDARRAKEDEIAIRCAFLEQENLKLRFEVAALKNEAERLRSLMYH